MSKKTPKIEDVNVTGPGNILSEARIQSGLSIDDVANKLNFRVILVKNIEADVFDSTLPDTYNRGYLKNYAKLVNVSISDVIGMYEKLNVFQGHHIEMQSFSRGTMKKAENNMLMWITYLILAIFIGFTVMWWLQDDKTPSTQKETASIVEVDNNVTEVNKNTAFENQSNVETIVENTISNPVPAIADELLNAQLPKILDESNSESLTVNNGVDVPLEPEVLTLDQSTLTKVKFTFAGDCWVNIYDALGDRIAWGIKKSGYVMTIDDAKTPLKITIGKPELVKINFSGESVDMSAFPKGHIAKFNLPLSPQS